MNLSQDNLHLPLIKEREGSVSNVNRSLAQQSNHSKQGNSQLRKSLVKNSPSQDLLDISLSDEDAPSIKIDIASIDHK